MGWPPLATMSAGAKICSLAASHPLNPLRGRRFLFSMDFLPASAPAISDLGQPPQPRRQRHVHVLARASRLRELILARSRVFFAGVFQCLKRLRRRGTISLHMSSKQRRYLTKLSKTASVLTLYLLNLNGCLTSQKMTKSQGSPLA